MEKIGLKKDDYTHHMVAATSDGASVNTGIYNGLLKQLRDDGRPWLLTVHCISHRLELSLKDSLLSFKHFKDVKDFMIVLFYLCKSSGKFKQQFKNLAKTLDSTVYSFAKVHGTRFINHVRNGLTRLLNNWPILKQCIENGIAGNDFPKLKAKLTGILKKLHDFQFLSWCTFYKALLDNVAKLSLEMERGQVQLFDLPCLLQDVKIANDELLRSNVTDWLKECKIAVADTVVSWELVKHGHMKRDVKNREVLTFEFPISDFTNFGVDKAQLRMNSDRDGTQVIIGAVKRCLEKRFGADDQINRLIQSMIWLDPGNWGNDDDDLAKIAISGEYFQVPLKRAGFNYPGLKKEWPRFKQRVQYFYAGMKKGQLWKNIFQYRQKEFPNICCLVSLLSSVGPSNSMVEKTFSVLNSMLNDRRMALSALTMEDLLLLQGNKNVWTEREINSIIDDAVESYMGACKRKLKLDEGSDNLLSSNSCAGGDESGGDGVEEVEIVDEEEDSENEDDQEAVWDAENVWETWGDDKDCSEFDLD